MNCLIIGDDEEDEVPQQKNKKSGAVNGTSTPAKGGKLNNSSKQTPKSEKKDKQEKQTPKTEEKTPKAKKTPGAAATPGTPSQKKVLEGGVIAEEMKTGEGPIAKVGKMVSFSL